MDELIKQYIIFLQERLDKKPLLILGEDSIRYDFFAAIMQTYDFKPSQIHIEVPIHAETFIPANDKLSKRKEKPLIDLVVNEEQLKISVEFGLFRQNSNEKGNINKTSRLVKMLNDMIRVSMEAHFTKTTGFFICVADAKMLGHQLRTNLFGQFPCDYTITNDFINFQLTQKTNNFDHRFLNVFQPMNKNVLATLVVNHELQATNIKYETRLLIWKVSID